MSLHIKDMDADGRDDLLLGGNFFPSSPFLVRNDASHGIVLKNVNPNTFKTIDQSTSGFFVEGEYEIWSN